MNSDLLYLQHYENGCRLLHCVDEQPHAAFIDLYQRPRWGNIYRGRVVKLEQNYAWIDIGYERPALLKRRTMVLHEGQFLIVRINREAVINRFEDKGPQVVVDDAYDRQHLNDGDISVIKKPMLIREALSSWERYIQSLTLNTVQERCLWVDSIELFDRTKMLPQSQGLKIRLHQRSFRKQIDLIWDEFLDDVHILPAGGYATMEETSVLTVIDVNTSALESGGQTFVINNDQDRLRFNIIAAEKIVQWMILRDLSGALMVDFLRHNNKRMDQQLSDYLKQQLSKSNQTKVLGYTSSGLVEILRPLRGLSLKAKSKLLKV